MERVLGIDLGTTNSVVAVVEGGEALVIPDADGSRILPSVVCYTREGERLVGQVARRQAATNPDITVYSVKRLMGMRYEEVGQDMENGKFSYTIVPNEQGDVRLKIGEKLLAPQEVSAAILQRLRQTAVDYLKEEISDVIITVPAYFNDSQRQATKTAGKIAGVNVIRLINEPTAAALAFGFEGNREMKLAVYDFGGGTFDVTILELREGIFEVLSTHGNTQLGGDDLDTVLAHWLKDRFHSQLDEEINLRLDRVAQYRLREAAEKAKRELSFAEEAKVNLPFIATHEGKPLHFQIMVNRIQLEGLTRNIVDKTLESCRQALNDAKLKPDDIDEVLLVGGSTRMPIVRQSVKEFFGKSPNTSVNPDEAVAVGAATQGGILSGNIKEVTLLDVTPLSLGVETEGGLVSRIIERNSTIPTRQSHVFTTTRDNQTVVNVNVVQGERDMARDCRMLGRLRLDNIPPMPREVPRIEVSFDIDANGILNVSALDLGTNQKREMTIVASCGLSDDEVDKMVSEAEKYATQDRQNRRLVICRLKGERLLKTAETRLKRVGDQLPQAKRKSAEKGIATLRKTLEEGHVESIEIGIGEFESLMDQHGIQLGGVGSGSLQSEGEALPEEFNE